MATVTNWIDHLNKPAEEVAVLFILVLDLAKSTGNTCYNYLDWLARLNCKI